MHWWYLKEGKVCLYVRETDGVARMELGVWDERHGACVLFGAPEAAGFTHVVAAYRDSLERTAGIARRIPPRPTRKERIRAAWRAVRDVFTEGG